MLRAQLPDINRYIGSYLYLVTDHDSRGSSICSSSSSLEALSVHCLSWPGLWPLIQLLRCCSAVHQAHVLRDALLQGVVPASSSCCFAAQHTGDGHHGADRPCTLQEMNQSERACAPALAGQ